ncbi:hypothetical protein VTI28DRAFT_5618 [Corynascus sepedonium]
MHTDLYILRAPVHVYAEGRKMKLGFNVVSHVSPPHLQRHKTQRVSKAAADSVLALVMIDTAVAETEPQPRLSVNPVSFGNATESISATGFLLPSKVPAAGGAKIPG